MIFDVQTRSLYKHMLGIKPTMSDMQAIDPDYYKNLQMILEHNLEDIGLELTFSTEDHSFGRYEKIDLIPGGRKVPVTEDSKERYVDLVCQHRMTTAIAKQIKAFLEGFHEIVDKQLISIFNARFVPFIFVLCAARMHSDDLLLILIKNTKQGTRTLDIRHARNRH
jgi:E3 ubiquitin-protein ligase HUWE1